MNAAHVLIESLVIASGELHITPHSRCNSPQMTSVCISIDLGTSRTGLAYCFFADPDRVIAHQQWPGQLSSNLKTPTAILIDSNRTCVAFGERASQIYAEMEPSERSTHYYFSRFKMALYGNKNHISIDELEHQNMGTCIGFSDNLQSENHLHNYASVGSNAHDLGKITISAENGVRLPLVFVLSEALRYLKNYALKLVSETSHVEEMEALFVLTVPAIWNFVSKEIMRLAASIAGFKKFILALEPESASFACIAERIEIKEDFEDGSEYVVMDCGGGTLDVVAHRHREIRNFPGSSFNEEISNNCHSYFVEEIIPASGGPWGSTEIDKEFEVFLLNMFGHEFMAVFRSENSDLWIELLNSWENVKLGFKSIHDNLILLTDEASEISFPQPFDEKDILAPRKELWTAVILPSELIDALRNEYGGEKGISERLRISCSNYFSNYSQENVVRFQRGRLKIWHEVVESFYKPVIGEITDHIFRVFSRPELSSCNNLFLVGGLARSSLLLSSLKNKLKAIKDSQGKSRSIRIIKPRLPDLAVVQGAALFGVRPEIVQSRVSRLTYGLRVVRPFNPDIHPEDRLFVTRTGERLCTDLFSIFIRRGTSLPVDHIVRKSVNGDPGAESVELAIYCSEKEDPVFVDEDKVRLLAMLVVDTKAISRSSIDLEMQFGQTDLRITAINPSTREILSTNVKFAL